MLQVVNARNFKGKKDPSKTYYVVDLLADDGQIAVDVFVDFPISVGSYVTVKERISNHKLGCTVMPIAEKK